jgi:NADPH:quinone reductase-like Zn-dependent oxidoreductase
MRHTRIIVTYYGGPDALRVAEEECPKPKDGEVRVRVLAAGVSLPDLLMREGVHIAFCPQSFISDATTYSLQQPDGSPRARS